MAKREQKKIGLGDLSSLFPLVAVEEPEVVEAVEVQEEEEQPLPETRTVRVYGFPGEDFERNLRSLIGCWTGTVSRERIVLNEKAWDGYIDVVSLVGFPRHAEGFAWNLRFFREMAEGESYPKPVMQKIAVGLSALGRACYRRAVAKQYKGRFCFDVAMPSENLHAQGVSEEAARAIEANGGLCTPVIVVMPEGYSYESSRMSNVQAGLGGLATTHTFSLPEGELIVRRENGIAYGVYLGKKG